MAPSIVVARPSRRKVVKSRAALQGAGGDVVVEPPDQVVAFGPYRLDRASGRLLRGGTNVPLRLKTSAVLEHLATCPGRQAATRGPRRARYRNRGKGRSRRPGSIRLTDGLSSPNRSRPRRPGHSRRRATRAPHT